MTWVRKDDQMPIHRKVAPLSDAAYRLLDEAICWSSRNLTDGAIASEELAEISKRGRVKFAEELVARRLWHVAGSECPSDKCPPSGEDGWVIHDYWDYNPTKAQVLAERQAKTERQRRWRQSKKGKPTVDGAVDASTQDVVDARVDASVDPHVDGAVAPAPSPPRPAPKEAGRGDPPRATAARRTAAEPAGGSREQPTAAHPPPKPAPPPDLSDVRAKLTAASRNIAARSTRRPGAFDELRAATTPPEPAAQELP